MPWTLDDPPRPAKNWSADRKRKCVAAANATLRRGGSEEKAIFACIGAAKDKELIEMDDKAKWQSVIDYIKGVFKEEESQVKPGLLLLKGDDGLYRFFARYSNKWRDRDDPPEIISEKSHLGFVDKVNAGEAPYPELWMWHVDKTAWGKSAWVGYDSGFALAAGYIYPEYNDVADVLKDRDDILLSHGMPISTIKRDPEDSTIIVEHETSEISVLPSGAAANKYTSFVVLKETDMDEMKDKGISPEDRKKLLSFGISENILESMEKANVEAEKAVDAAGVESKEKTEVETEESVETEEVETDGEVNVDDGEDAASVESEPNAEEDTEAGEETVDGPDLKEVTETLGALITVFNALNDKVEGIQEDFGKFQTGYEKQQKQVSGSPLASKISMLYSSVVGDEAARVDGRKSLAKDKPKETEPNGDGAFFFQQEGWTV